MEQYSCYLCGDNNSETILDRSPVRIWTNAGDDEAVNASYRCKLNQCKKCGHVYQPMDKTLDDLLNLIYQSEHAQVSTPAGKGNWGMERAAFYCSHIDVKGISSVLEIGGGDGYILRYLQTQGVNKLVNIEPSLPKSYEAENISYVKNFASESVDLGTTFDLVLSIGVFEHIEKINDVLRFCKKHLAPGGRLLFSVPNSDGCLLNGDPSLFLHQHIHYYTDASLRNLLAHHGFSVINIAANYDALIVSAVIDSNAKENKTDKVSYNSYDAHLSRVIENVKKLLTKSPGKTIVHGANGALNNLLGWMGGNYDFTLVDNDETKHGKIYFGKTIHAFQKIDLSAYTQVVIVPHAFHPEIKAAYEKAGFKGNIAGILE